MISQSIALELKAITKRFGSCVANSAVSLRVLRGTIHALAGENGAGKSTLMKILFGLESPDNGEILVEGKAQKLSSPMDAIKLGVGMVQQHFALVGKYNAIDNIILGAEPSNTFGRVDRRAAIEEIERIAHGSLSVNLVVPLHELSLGDWQKVEIIKLLYRQADILILDEPTAVLSPQEVQRFFALLKELRAQNKTIILITHKLQEIFDICDEVTVLRQGRSVAQSLPIKSLTSEALIEHMIGRKTVAQKPLAMAIGATVVEINNVRDPQKNKGEPSKLNGVQITIHQNEVVGIAGIEGNGQHELVEALLGLRKVQGEIKFNFDPKDKGVIPPDRHHEALWLDETLSHNFLIGHEDCFSKGYLLNWKRVSEETQKAIQKYTVRSESVNSSVKDLSGGNQQKLVAARELDGRDIKFLIAAHPTRGVDVGAIEFIHQRILEKAKSGVGVLLISSELDELMALSDRILVLFKGQIVGEFLARDGYDTFQIGKLMTGGAQ